MYVCMYMENWKLRHPLRINQINWKKGALTRTRHSSSKVQIERMKTKHWEKPNQVHRSVSSCASLFALTLCDRMSLNRSRIVSRYCKYNDLMDINIKCHGPCETFMRRYFAYVFNFNFYRQFFLFDLYVKLEMFAFFFFRKNFSNVFLKFYIVISQILKSHCVWLGERSFSSWNFNWVTKRYEWPRQQSFNVRVLLSVVIAITFVV